VIERCFDTNPFAQGVAVMALQLATDVLTGH
jgi:hypothetical protein